MGLWRWRTSGARRFAGNVRFGIVLAGLTTAATAAVRAIDGGTKKSGEEPEAQGADESQAGELKRRDAEAAVVGPRGEGMGRG